MIFKESISDTKTRGVDTRFTIALFAVLLSVVVSIGCRGKASPLAPSAASEPIPDSRPQNSYADVISRVAPAVVTIRADKRVRAPQQPQEQVERALGSGVIVSPDGYVLTNHHVIDGAEQIKIDMNDGRTIDAKLVGSDPPSDLAVLKVPGNALTFLTPGDSDKVRVGDVALAIGNPLGIGQTVTMGIISAKGRSTAGPGAGNFEDFLQTDAPINQGNSGGALINTNGELIGINSQIIGGMSGGNIGIGFAIPSNMARSVLDQLVKNGKVRRGQLGIGVQRVTSDVAESLGLSDTKGVIVTSVRPGSGAEKAGIRRGDVITALNETPVRETNAFRNQIAGFGPGAEVTLTVIRDNREQKIRATLGEFTDETAQAEQQGNQEGPASTAKLGLGVEPITPEIAAQLNLRPGTQGVVVVNVDPAGPAAEAGITRGDVIEEVNRQPIRSADDLRAAIARSGNRPALFLLNRRGETIYLTIRPRQ